MISGDGVTKPTGFLSATTSTAADGARTFGQIQRRNTGVAGNWPATDSATYDLLVDLTLDLRQPYLRNAKWYMPRSALNRLTKLKDSSGQPIWSHAKDGAPDMLLGYPVERCDAMPAVANNALSVAFADLKSAYLIVDRVGIRMLRDPYTNKPHVGFYTTMRVGGILQDDDAIKVIQFAV